jgi:Lon-like protease
MAQRPDSSRFFGRKNIRGVIITILFAISFFIPTPYYLYRPGSAEELAPKVTVQGGQKDEKGTLMLTTVLSIKASNIYYLAYGYVAPHTEIRKEEEVKQGMSDDEYNRLLKHMMDTSQQNAIVAGLKAAGEKVDVSYNGVFITGILPTSNAKGVLQVGDVIDSIDNQPLKKAEDLVGYLNDKKKAGDTVEVTYLRDKDTHTAKVKLMELGENNQTTPGVPKKVGLGVVPENEASLQLPRKVDIHAEDIGGPSAGLMFSLEIYSQATPGDLTKGYRIAGTGTMDQDGKVGQIGGIRHKIYAAHDQGAEIFFAPADVDPRDTNTAEVQDEVKKAGFNIKIVPVKTVQDAIDYLKKLPPKS